MGAGIIQHGSPTCRGWRHSQAEKAQCGFREHSAGHSYGRLHNDWLKNIWQNVARENMEIASAQCACRLDKFALLDGEDLRANEARIPNPPANRKRENEIH